MLNVIQYTGEFVSLEMSSRPLDDLTDIWLRKNPRTSQDDEGNTIHLADEAYMQIDIADAPDRATVEANFDLWYDTAAAWTDSGDDSEIIKRLSAAEAKNAELTSIIYTLMGVNIDG
jgi:hypothetical protein